MEPMVSILDLKKISALRTALEQKRESFSATESHDLPGTLNVNAAIQDLTDFSLPHEDASEGTLEKYGWPGIPVCIEDVSSQPNKAADTSTETPGSGIECSPKASANFKEAIDSEEIILESSVPGVAETQVIESDHAYESSSTSDTIVSLKETIKALQRQNEIMVGIIDDLLAAIPTIPKEVIPDLLALGLKTDYLCLKSIKKPRKYKTKRSKRLASKKKRRLSLVTKRSALSVKQREIDSHEPASKKLKTEAGLSESMVLGKTFHVRAYMCSQCKKTFLNPTDVNTHRCDAVESAKSLSSSMKQLNTTPEALPGKFYTFPTCQSVPSSIKVVAPQTPVKNTSTALDGKTFIAFQCVKCAKCFLTKELLQGHACVVNSPEKLTMLTQDKLAKANTTNKMLLLTAGDFQQKNEGDILAGVSINIMQKHCQLCSKVFDSVEDLESHQCIFETLDSITESLHTPVIESENLFDFAEDSTDYDPNEAVERPASTNLMGSLFPSGKSRSCRPPKFLNNSFKCEICQKVLTSKSCYYEHKVCYHSDHKTAINCPDCLRTFFSHGGYESHLEKCKVSKDRGLCASQPVEIEVLNAAINMGDVLSQDTQPFQVDPKLLKPFGCPECGNRFYRQVGLLFHLNKVHGVKNARKTTDDGKTSKIRYGPRTRPIAERTKESRSAEKAPFYAQECICDQCGEVFKNSVSLVLHMRAHENNGIFPCKLCEQTFNTKIKLKSHVSAVHPESLSYVCDICGEAFYYQKTLRNHLFRKHNGPPSFTCEVCGRGFVFKNSYQIHLRKHTNEKNFFCKKCPDKAFHDRGQLMYHNLAHHTAERRYPCDFCSQKFKLSCNRSTHVRNVHMKEKRFGCELCSHRCNTTSGMRKHMLTHTRQKPFYCEVCAQGFIHRYKMNAHMKEVHDIIVETPERGASQMISRLTS